MVDVSAKWPTSPEYYNSAVTVSRTGDVIANYRKSFLYYTDETWALEGRGFFGGHLEGLGAVAMGICMDLNPYKFEAPWDACEFAYHVLDCQANLVILSMAWLTHDGPELQQLYAKEPDMDTLSYWLTRIEPLIRGETEGEIIVVFANRTGVEGEAVYAGTSAVLGIDAGEVTVYGLLGRGERRLLVVDTEGPPHAKLVLAPANRVPAAPNASDVSTNSMASKDSESSIHTGSVARTTPESDDEASNFAPAHSPKQPHSPAVYFGPQDLNVEDDIPIMLHEQSHPQNDVCSGEPIDIDVATENAPLDADAIRMHVQSKSPSHLEKPIKKNRPASAIW